MNVLLVDDHPLTNKGVASCLEGTGRFTVDAQVTTLAGAKRHMEEAGERLPCLVILDIILGEENGLDFLPFLEDHCNRNGLAKSLVLVCSVLEEPFRIQSAIKLGASGYVSKAEAELLAAIDTILCGEVYLSERHHVRTLQNLGIYEKLSKREIEVFELVKKDMTNKEIAKELSLTLHTVENHVSNLYFKTRVKRAQAWGTKEAAAFHRPPWAAPPQESRNILWKILTRPLPDPWGGCII
ncbi:MAG: response regulator transcription factor [Treponema sp.]|nr:response regulator transcription factor [Treponema sp.]